MKKYLTWNNLFRVVIGAAAGVAALSGAGVVALPAWLVKTALGVGIVAAKVLPGNGVNAPEKPLELAKS